MRRILTALMGLLLVVGIAACGSAKTSTSTSGPASSSPSTRQVKHLMGTATIPSHPQRVVSTSVVLTGSLLAIDAPVVGSGGSKPNVPGLDSHGWWTHWSSIAEQRHVQSLFTNGNLDLEAITAARPDVIIVSATGGDSFADKYAQLNKIAPTLVIDYNSHSWEEVTTTLGDDLGLHDRAVQVLASFHQDAAEARRRITAPSTPVDLAVYSGNGGLAVGLPTAPQALVLKELGVQVSSTGVTPEKGRTDFAFTTPEQSVKALKASQMLLAGNDDSDLKALMADSRFASIPSIKTHQVHSLGLASFKLDYYAAKDLVQHVVDIYGK